MIPDTVKFTDLEIDPRAIMTPRKYFRGVYPLDWTRHQFTVKGAFGIDLRTIDRWLEANIAGRWGSYVAADSRTVVILFELLTDAIMFRMKDGETASLSGDQNSF